MMYSNQLDLSVTTQTNSSRNLSMPSFYFSIQRHTYCFIVIFIAVSIKYTNSYPATLLRHNIPTRQLFLVYPSVLWHRLHSISRSTTCVTSRRTKTQGHTRSVLSTHLTHCVQSLLLQPTQSLPLMQKWPLPPLSTDTYRTLNAFSVGTT